MSFMDAMLASMSGMKENSPEEYREEILADHRSSVEEYEEMHGPNSYTFHFNQTIPAPIPIKRPTQLANAQPISLKEIQAWNLSRGDKVFEGRVLLCTTIEWPFKMTSIMTIVEDDDGRAERLALYNFAKTNAIPRSVLPKNSILANIIDPLYKTTADHGRTIRVDNPQSVVFFNGDDIIDFKRKKGTFKATISEENTFSPKMLKGSKEKSAEELKGEGNTHFQKGRYEAAMSCYTKALQSNPNDNTRVILLSNRSECLLRIPDYRGALSDSIAALELDPTHAKSKHRKCKALVGLRKFSEAAAVLPDHARNPDLDEATKKLMARGIIEEQGKFDVFSMMKEAEEDPLLSGHADYVCPDIQIGFVSAQKGRGVIATKDFKFGTLIMASKAAAIAFADITKLSIQLDPFSNLINSQTQIEVIGDLMRGVARDPELGKQLYDLYAGDGLKQGEFDSADVDEERIRGIVRLNAFNGESLTKQTNMKTADGADTEAQRARYAKARADRENRDFMTPTGVWIKQSYLNHSCLPNYMFVITSKDIKKDEELTLAYVDPMDSYLARKTTLKRGFGFTCKCEVCAFFEAKPHFANLEKDVEAKFDAAREGVYVERRHTILPILVSLVNNTIQAFGKYLEYASCIFLPLTAIVSVLEREGGDYEQIVSYSQNVSAIAERVSGRGNTHWVMSKIHEVMALAQTSNAKFFTVLLDTCQAFLSRYHTSPQHFQKAYINSIPLLREAVPDIGAKIAQYEKKSKYKKTRKN